MSRNYKSVYINRELSWLSFNLRVLKQAEAPEVPLLERMRFCAIYTSNLDEFFMVRAGSLHDRTLLSPQPIDDKTGMTAGEQLHELYKAAHAQYPKRDKIYRKIAEELRERGVISPKWNELDKAERKSVEQFFTSELSPILRTHIVDQNHPFPHLENKQPHIILTLKNRPGGKQSGERLLYAIIPLPHEAPKYWSKTETDENGNFVSLKYITSERIIMHYTGRLYKKYDIKSKLLFKVTRNADLEIGGEENDDITSDHDYLKHIKTLLKKRDKLSPVRLEYLYSENAESTKTIELLRKRFSLSKEQVYCTHSPLSYDFASELIKELSKIIDGGCYAPIAPIPATNERSIFAAVEKRDLLLNYPYNSMMTYIDFLREAAYDENVESIKITLYRLSRYSEVVSLLKYAAARGKNVTAVVELKARFDEENNIHWAEALEESGCNVIYGIGGLKVHSKVTLVTKKEQDCYRRYAHIATGNYNEQTAKLYTDIGIITADEEICGDAAALFENIEAGRLSDEYKRLLVSPTCLKQRLLTEIEREKTAALLGKTGYIRLKMNSLTDKQLIDALIGASKCGVRIDLIIRGICCLRAGVPGETDNIRVISIVGRYLEHSRIYIFGENAQNPGASDRSPRVYIGSADLMTRNTTRRIEVLTPVLDDSIASKLITLTDLELRDNVKACAMRPDGSYKKIESQDKPCDSQIEIYNLYK